MPFFIPQRLPQRGFTLTELVLIIVIIGAVMVTAAPRFIATQTFESRGFYEEVLASLRYAQKMAVGTGCPILFTITAAPASYGMSRGTVCADGNFIGGPPITNPRTGIPYPTLAPNNVVIANVTNFPIVFNASGQAINTPVPPAIDPPTASVSIDGRVIMIQEETGLVQ